MGDSAITYATVCSGIEAPTVAWHALGWHPMAFSEIEAFPSAVLAHHYPTVPNLGDMTQAKWEDYRGAVDLVCGGTPCQSFSVAGLRAGLADPRGNLTLTYLAVLDAIRPQLDGLGERPRCAVGQNRERLEPSSLAWGNSGMGSRTEFLTLSTVSPTLRAMGGNHANAGGQVAVAFNITPSNSNKDYNARSSDRAQAVTTGGNRPSARGGDVIVSSAVRRLTPRECERLQGFPDDYTLIPYRGKPAADGPRYKALGNSMAVPVMRWIGERIALVDALLKTEAA